MQNRAMPLIDTHCHLDFNAYDGLRDQIIQDAAAVGVTRIINPGIDLASSRAALSLVDTYPGLYAAVGIHPNSSAQLAPTWLTNLATLAAHPKVVALGEIGLDYYRDHSPQKTQWAVLEAQLALAAELCLPVLLHNREASADLLEILSAWVPSLSQTLQTRPGVLHSFSAPTAIAEQGLALGFYLGFTGPVTFKKADDLRQIAARVPEDRILVETDGPFLTPHPHRGQRPNQPAYVRFIAARIAALRQLPDDVFAQKTTANAERLFALSPVGTHQKFEG